MLSIDGEQLAANNEAKENEWLIAQYQTFLRGFLSISIFLEQTIEIVMEHSARKAWVNSRTSGLYLKF
jgi:hypothetical protein